jgi:signal transduction histidine kinase
MELAMRPTTNLGKLAVIIPLILLGMIFVVESSIMLVLAATATSLHNRWLEVIVDSSVLTLTVAPALYWLIVRPLRQIANERSRLLAHMMEVQDTERRRLARDLHDEIGQSFTSLLVQLRVLEDALTLDDAKTQVRQLRELSSQIYDQIRGLARGIHPTVLDDLGLVEAVKRLAEDFEAVHDVSVTVQVSGFSKDRLDQKIENTAYRIVQESLTNCAKYAHPTHIAVSLAVETHQLLVIIADDGQGFEVLSTRQESQATTFGLASMRERALLLNGSLEVRSRKGSGTTIKLSVPLDR